MSPSHRHRRQPHPRPHRRVRQGHRQGLYTHLDVAVTDRTRNNQGDWVDGPATYYRVTVFGKTAENATNSLAKGNTVVVTGDLTVRAHTRTDGTPGVGQEVIADHLGAALTYTTATINPKTAAQTD